jgi:hypothetical protein
VEVPLIITLTPIKGSPEASFTLPVTVFWAKLTNPSIQNAKAKENRLIFRFMEILINDTNSLFACKVK